MSCNYNCNDRMNPCHIESSIKGSCPPPPNSCFTPSCDPCNTCCDTLKGPCCTGITVNKFNPSQAETIFAYINRIFDGKIGPGSALVESITTSTIPYTTQAQYTACGTNCCGTTNCTVGVGAVFTVENVVSELISLRVTTTIPAGSVFVNGTSIPNAPTNNGDGTYTVSITSANSVPNSLCTNPQDKKCVGTKSTMMLNNIAGWTYLAQHTITGKVNYLGNMCNFCAVIKDNTTGGANTANGGHTIPSATTSTMILQDLCIPSAQSQITLSFRGNITLLNPILSIQLQNPADPNSATQLVLQANAIVTPEVVGEVVERTRACLQVML